MQQEELDAKKRSDTRRKELFARPMAKISLFCCTQNNCANMSTILLPASALKFDTFSFGGSLATGSDPSLLPRACHYLPLEPLCFPAGPDTSGSDGSPCQQMSVINSDVMDRCGAAAETSWSSSALPCQTAGGPEGGHFVPSCRPLTGGTCD